MGILQVNVSVINPPPDVELFATIDLGIQSLAITASKYDIKLVYTIMVIVQLLIAGDADYEEIRLKEFDVLLVFDDMNRRLSFPVTINDDDLLESTEDFNLELRFDPFVTQQLEVILNPNMSTVYIEDDDGNYIIDCSILLLSS